MPVLKCFIVSIVTFLTNFTDCHLNSRSMRESISGRLLLSAAAIVRLGWKGTCPDIDRSSAIKTSENNGLGDSASCGEERARDVDSPQGKH